MATSPDTLDKFQKTLEPYIKPREQVNYIRRVLALHLGSCNGEDGPIKRPVSLIDSSHDIALGKELKGIQRAYVEAVKANVAARQKYDATLQSCPTSQPQAQGEPESSVDLVDERISLLRIQTKLERLQAVQKHFDLLVQKPAASQEFLNPDDIFENTASLPNVPKEVVNSLVARNSSAKSDLKGQVAQLEKTVLRTKLLLRREEQLLRETRSKAKSIPDVLSNGTRMEALNATRNELITWIETELSNAGGDEEADHEGAGGFPSSEKTSADKATINTQLENIKEKYARYLASRRSLLSKLSEASGLSLPPTLPPVEAKPGAAAPEPVPSSYLLTPYIELLLAISRKQKAMITQKSHMNAILSKQIKADYQTLGAMAEESQLLPQFPMQGSSRRRSILGEVLTDPTSKASGFQEKVQPWVFAADAAKITTLERVAEKIEGGQVALESSMKALEEIDRLLGKYQGHEDEAAQEDQTEDDFWLDDGAKHPSSARKHTEKKKDVVKKPKDAFSGIHGNLGLLGQED